MKDRPQPQATGIAANRARNGTTTMMASTNRTQRDVGSPNIDLFTVDGAASISAISGPPDVASLRAATAKVRGGDASTGAPRYLAQR